MKHVKTQLRKTLLGLAAGAVIASGGVIGWSSSAYACCTCGLTIITPSLAAAWPATQRVIRNRISTERTSLQQWYVNTLWEHNLLPAMMLFADQMSAVAMHQTAIIGTFMDAKHQMETQRTLQTIRARAHKDYHPSEGLCQFGSTAKSLAASERRAELTAHVMSQRFEDRMLGNANSAAAGGPAYDKPARLRQFREEFCDRSNHNGGLDYLCEHDQNGDLNGPIGAQNRERVNKDIDFTRTIDYPWTLNVDFSDAAITDHEEEVLALADNLYGHDVFNRLTGAPTSQGGLKPATGDEFVESIHGAYMDARAVLAKLSVAKNSYNAITSMKAAGTPGSREYLQSVLSELGVDGQSGGVENIDLMLGHDGTNPVAPSYHAQMEVLTKKIYQNPDFYTNLYDKPVNIERKKVAMQAVGLMQKFDLFKSYLRYEASLSVLLELAVIDLQERLELEIGDQSAVKPSNPN